MGINCHSLLVMAVLSHICIGWWEILNCLYGNSYQNDAKYTIFECNRWQNEKWRLKVGLLGLSQCQ